MELMSDPRDTNDPPSSAAGGGRSRRGLTVPDILYHGTTRGRAERFFQSGGVIPSQGRQVFLSTRESEAWRIAHRFNQEPAVLYVDAGRARREGVAIRRVREGLFVADRVPARYVLNLRGGFREQISAGGLLLRRDRGGLELALVACARSRRVTWEIAKGKLEPGETPEQAALREMQEEMGFSAELTITHRLGQVRYGFRTPEGDPRLKTLHVYLVEAPLPPEIFRPAQDEGIEEVRWFPLHDAVRLVTHSSLIPLMARVRALLHGEPLDDLDGSGQ